MRATMDRRSLLKLVVSGGAGASAGGLSTLLEAQASTVARANKLEATTETTTICPYCGCGCGIVVSTRDGKVVNTEGDPDHPINEGALCSKGAALYQVINNPLRLTKPKYRAAGATEFKEVEWDWALDEIAKRVKDTRDRTFKLTSKSKVKEKLPDGTEQDVEKDFVVNRTDGI